MLFADYDAANRLRHTDYEYMETESYTRQQEWITYDGDGQIVKVETTVQDEENGPPVDGDTTYRIRSTVLGGQVVYENQMAYIFAGGDLLARQNANGVMWSHKDPNMKSYRSTGAAGTVLGDGITNADWDKIESDPDGKSVGFTDPGVTNPTESNELYISGWSFGSMRNGQYNTHVVDGIHVPAEFLATRVGADRPGFGLDLLEFTAYQSTIQTGWRVRYRANDVTRTRDYSMSQYERVYDHWLEGAEIITPLFNNDWSTINLISGQTPRQTPPQTDPNKCGLNPITRRPGILDDKPSTNYPANNAQGTGREGKRGNIRAGNGGSGGFEERTGGAHNGIDIASPIYQVVYASIDGVVKRANQVEGLGKTAKERGGKSQNYGWGGLVVINYDGMALNGAYAHLFHVYVKEGDKVKAGDLIGLTGRTGNANNPDQPEGDDHLHYGRFTGEYNGGSLANEPWIDPQASLNSPCPKR